jgi:hypothetical protein
MVNLHYIILYYITLHHSNEKAFDAGNALCLICYMGLHHHSMACACVADGRDNFQVWRVAGEYIE